jgi:hypothetical protein
MIKSNFRSKHFNSYNLIVYKHSTVTKCASFVTNQIAMSLFAFLFCFLLLGVNPKPYDGDAPSCGYDVSTYYVFSFPLSFV